VKQLKQPLVVAAFSCVMVCHHQQCFFMSYGAHSPVYFCCCCDVRRLLLILSVISSLICCVSMILSCPIYGSLLLDIASLRAVVGGPALIILHKTRIPPEPEFHKYNNAHSSEHGWSSNYTGLLPC